MQGLNPSSAEVKRTLDRIFARPEFVTDERTLLDDFLEWLGETVDLEANTGALNSVADLLVNVLVLVLALVFAWLVFRLAKEHAHRLRGRRSRVSDANSQIRQRVRELYAAAAQARAAGNTKLAIQLGLFALVTGLGARGAFKYRDAWTYREILAHGQPHEAAARLLNELVADLEAKEFGAEPVSEQDLDRLEGLCVEHLSGYLEPIL